MDEDFNSKIRSIGDQYKANVHRTINQHLIKKYTETCHTLAVLDDTDMGLACQIAQKQLLRSNHRLNANKADRIINAVIFDTRDCLSSQLWHRPRNPASSKQASPPQATTPIQTSNRFQPLESLDDNNQIDQMEADHIIELLGNTMTDPETLPATTPSKRPAS